MPHLLPRSLCLVAMATPFLLLSGCILDPVSLIADPIMYAASSAYDDEPVTRPMTAEELGIGPEQYRQLDCTGLSNSRDAFQSIQADGNLYAPMYIDAINQVMTEKSCPGANAVATTQAAAGAVASGYGQLGMQIRAVDANMAVALGMSSTQGVLVDSVVPAGPADRAGIKSMDVILSIAGQAALTPSDLQQKIRSQQPGASVPVTVWHEGALQNIQVQIGDVRQATATPTAPATATATATASTLAGAPAAKRFCHAYLAKKGKLNGVHSPIMESATDGSASAMSTSLSRFVAKVHQAQPGKWGHFSITPDQCDPYSGLCLVTQKDQTAGQFCFGSRAEADAQFDHFVSVDPGIALIQ